MNSHVFTSHIVRNNIFLFLADLITVLMDRTLEKFCVGLNIYLEHMSQKSQIYHVFF